MRRSTFKILFYLKRGSLTKKNGKATVMARITIDGEITQFSAKQEVASEQWDNVKGKALGSSATSHKINRELDLIRSSLTVHYNTQMATVGYCTPTNSKTLFWEWKKNNTRSFPISKNLMSNTN